MIAGFFHEGSGLGDQLFRYITVRTLAEKKGFEWQMMGDFKGQEFMPLAYERMGSIYDWGRTWNEKQVTENGIDIRSYDPEINFIEDGTTIDGSFEDDKYWRYSLKKINEWLRVEPLEVADDLCVIGFRGGEYYSDPNLGLPIEYYKQAMDEVLKINPKMKFEIHTDDTLKAREFFYDIPIIENQKISHSKHSNMGYNWRAMRHAKYAVIANSSFYILPRILSGGLTIAPRGWARRNVGVWARPACYYPEFTYI